MTEETKSEILQDYAKDVKTYMEAMKGIVVALCIVLLAFVIGMVVLEVHNQKMMAEISKHASDTITEFLSEYDWEVEYEITSTNNDLFSGNITVEK